MKVLIAGGGGLIGTHLGALLAGRSAEVTAITRRRDERVDAMADAGVRPLVADLATGGIDEALGSEQFDAVVYLAQSERFREFPAGANDMTAVNVAGAVRLAQWAAEHGTRTFVYGSTGAVYAPSLDPHREDEVVGGAPLGFYAASKLAGECAVRAFSTAMRTVVLRPFFVYGPGMNQTMLINALIGSVREGRTITLSGDPDGLRFQPTAAADAAEQVAALLDGDGSDVVVNIVGDREMTLREVAERIGAAVGREPVFQHVPGPSQAVLADTTRIRALTPACAVALDDGLARMVR